MTTVTELCVSVDSVSLVKDACRFLDCFSLETRHVEGCVERPGVPSRNSGSCSLLLYRYWQCDRLFCCLCVKREHSIELLLGSEGPVKCSSPACAETSFLLARRPSLWTPLGVIPVASGTVHSLRDRAASEQGPGHHTVTYGVVAARRPPMDNNRPTLHVPQPLLHWGRRLRATQAPYGLSGWCC